MLDFLPAECLPLKYDLNSLSLELKTGFFLNSFPISFSSFQSSFSCNVMPRSGLHGVKPN